MKKLYRSKFVIFILGLFIGLLICRVHNHNMFNNTNEYYELQNDYSIDNVGVLKSGTLVKIVEGMDEGFSRYILYLNISDGEELTKHHEKEKDMVIPYWLVPKDSLKKKDEN